MQSNYSEEFKRAMVKKMIGPPERSASSLSSEVGVSKSALAQWRRLAVRPEGMKAKSKRKSGKSAEEKMRIITQASKLEENELGAFLRKEGVYEVQLEQWRSEMIQGLSGEESHQELRAQLKAERKKTSVLEKELKRKEKALAEAAALLVLQKKVADYFGVDEEEDIHKKKS